MLNLLVSSFLLLLILFCHSPKTFAQSPTQAPAAQPLAPVAQPQAPAAAPPGPTKAPAVIIPKAKGPPNITAILDKAGHFSTFIRLLRSTQMDGRVSKELNSSDQALTILAPSDNAFGNLSTGTLNSFNDEQKVELIEFHFIPSFISPSQFQTVSNPLRTQAGESSKSQFPLNVVTAGDQVNITSGIVNATVSDTVYTDGQLAVYQLDQVLLPMRFFSTPSPAPAPSKPEKQTDPSSSSSGSSSAASVEASGAASAIHLAIFDAMAFVASLVAVFSLCF